MTKSLVMFMNMYTADYFIKKLEMQPHQEGGYFKEIEASSEEITVNNEGIENTVTRKLWTSIYFLLRDGEVSNFHRLKSDEMWYYHAGSSLTIYMISPEGELIIKELGLEIELGETPQVLVPKGYIFGSAMNKQGYSLVGCMVSPGFDYHDFELFERAELLKKYPAYEKEILKLTLDK